MKKKIYKILSLLLVLAVLVTTCAHGNWFVATAADATPVNGGETFINGVVSPALETGHLQGVALSATNLVVTNSVRFYTPNTYLISDFDTIIVPEGAVIGVRSFSSTGGHEYDSGWLTEGTYSISDITKSGVKYFKVTLAKKTSDDKGSTTESPTDTQKQGLKFNAKNDTYTILPALTKARLNNSSGGKIEESISTKNTDRVTTTYNYKIDNVESINFPSNTQTGILSYDNDGKQTRDSGWIATNDATGVTNKKITELKTNRIDPSATYFKFQVRKYDANNNNAIPSNWYDIAITIKDSYVPVTNVELDHTTATLEVDATLDLIPTITPNNATNPDVTWTSDTPKVATVVNGVVTAVSAGKATITCTSVSNPNISDTCTVTVQAVDDGKLDYYEGFQIGELDKDGNAVNPFDGQDGNCDHIENKGYVCEHEYIRMADKLEIEKYKGIAIPNEYQMWIYFYDARGAKVASTEGWVNTVYTQDAMKQVSNATYFRAYFRLNPDMVVDTTFTHDEIDDVIRLHKIDIREVEVVTTGENYPYYVSASPIDGKTVYTTINEAIKAANQAGYKLNDTVTILVSGEIDWKETDEDDTTNKVNLEPHTFKVVITRKENDNSATVVSGPDKDNKNIHFGGDVEIKNITLKMDHKYDMLFTDNHDITLDSTVNIVYDNAGNKWPIIAFGKYQNAENEASKFENHVTAEINAPVKEVYLSNLYGPSIVNDTINVHYNNADGNPIFYLGPNALNKGEKPSSTVYNTGIDMIIDDVKDTIEFKNTNNVSFGPGGFLQVLNNAAVTDPDANDEIYPVVNIDNQVALDNASSVWIVNNQLEKKSRIKSTGYKGIYNVSGSETVYVFKEDQQVAESRNGQINIAALGGGIYYFREKGSYSVPTYPVEKDNKKTVVEIINDAVVKQTNAYGKDLYSQYYIDLSKVSSIDFGNAANLKAHNFEVVIWSGSDKKVVNVPTGTKFNGSIKFDNVQIQATTSAIVNTAVESGELYLDGHDFTATATSEIKGFTNIYAGCENGGEYSPRMNGAEKEEEEAILDGDQVITIETAYSETITLGSANGTAVYKKINYGLDDKKTGEKDLYLVINNSKSAPVIHVNGSYQGDLNINIKRAKIKDDAVVNITGNNAQITQLIRYSKAKVNVYGDEVKGDTYTNYAKYDIIDKSHNTGCIDCTETAGKYTSNTEFIVSAYANGNLQSTPKNSADDILVLTAGKWTLTTTDYFEDFKGMSTDEITDAWNTTALEEYSEDAIKSSGTWKYAKEKIHLTSAGYIIHNYDIKREDKITSSIFTNKNITSEQQFISVDFEGKDITKVDNRSTRLVDTNGNGNIRDNGKGVALFARLNLQTKQAYELKVARNRIILTKRDGDDTTRQNEAGRPGSNADYSVQLYKDNELKHTFANLEEYGAYYKTLTQAKKDVFNGLDHRYQLISSDFEVGHINSYMNYNRFPESYDEGNEVRINEDHIYRLGMSVVDGEEGTAYVRILLLDVTTNRLLVDETFKDLHAAGFGGNQFGFGLYGATAGDTSRYCEADFDNVWFSSERFRGGDMGEFNDINYDSYFDVRDLVRTYEYMGGANARINFSAADRDYNGFITTFDESEIRKELLWGAGDTFNLVGQREEEADVHRDGIVNMATTGEGSGIVVKDGVKWYYPDLSKQDSDVSYLKGREVEGSVYYVSTSAKEPQDFTIDSTTAISEEYFVSGSILPQTAMLEEYPSRLRSNYFIKLDDNLQVKLKTGGYLLCYIYDEDFNYLGRREINEPSTIKKDTFNDVNQLNTKAKQVYVNHLKYSPKYVKFVLYYGSGTFDRSKVGDYIEFQENNSGEAITISGYDYHKNDECTQDKPWTYRQFQLYADSQAVTSESTNNGKSAVRFDPLCVIKSGDAVLFKRGDEFTDIKQVQVLSLSDQVFASYCAFFGQDTVLYGAYGTGEKPILNASAKDYAKKDNGKSLWTKAEGKENIYYCDVSDITKYDNNRDNSVLNVIFNVKETVSIGVRKFFAKDDLHTLYKNGQYATQIIKDNTGNVTGGKLYLYCDKGSPDEYYGSIHLTRCFYGGYINIGAQNIVMDNLNFFGFGGGGIRGAFNCPNNTTQNCEISYSGGMIHPTKMYDRYNKDTGELEATPTYDKKYGLRYGNGIETWENSENFVIDHNWIYHTFDSAVSPQGDGNSTGNYNGFAITNNIFEYNNADVEYFDDAPATKQTILNKVQISNNIFRFTSFGWGTRESDKLRGIQGVLRMDLRNDEYIDINYTNNLIDTPGMEIFSIKNFRLADGSTDYDGDLYKFGYVYKKTTTPVYESNGTTQIELKNNGDKSNLGGNRYYYNYYVRNYPYVSTNYMLSASDNSYDKTARTADTGTEFAKIMEQIDTGVGTEFYWYSTKVN